MFDVDPGKIALFCAVALIVVGPKDLPVALRFLGRIFRQFGQVRTRLQSDFRNALEDADVEGVNRELKSVRDLMRVDLSYNAATAMRGRPPPDNQAGGTLATTSHKDNEATKAAYASPEMALYLGALAQPALPSADTGGESSVLPEPPLNCASRHNASP